jgi:hypothetical protein
MDLRRLTSLFILAIFLGPLLVSQEGSQSLPGSEASEQAVFYPFVTELRGQIRNNLLRLSWRDSPDLRGPVFVYRSLSPFQGNISAEIQPIEVPYGAESYIDEIDNSGIYYYFVAASDLERNHRIGFFSGNTISMEVTESIALLNVRTPVPQEPAPAVTASGVSALRVQAEDSRVIISFRYEKTGNLILYRGIRPITRAADLLGAVIIKREAGSPFIDNPVPGIPYYYAVVPEEELIHGTVAILPGINATLEPTQVVQENAGGSANVRAVPLPFISLAAATQGNYVFEDTPRNGVLSPEAIKALENIPVYQKNPPPLKNSHIFSRDLETSGLGEDYLLGAIIQGPFLNNEWNTAQDELLRFLDLPRSGSSEARARFYLGQCYYYSHSLREALFEFLQARVFYPDEAAEWIQVTLNTMVE